jgi:hypothetical protein
MTSRSYMSRKRRNTIPLEEFQSLINQTLARDQRHSPEWRQGLCVALHLALCQANNYGGWEYLEEAGVEYEVVDGDLRPRVQDRTRRRFFTLDDIEQEADRLYAGSPQRAASAAERGLPAPQDDVNDLETDRIFPKG